jgi:ribosomal protein S2
MKIDIIENKKYRLFKYNLLKLQIYSKQNKKNLSYEFTNNLLEFLEIHLKQLLKIIHEYHINHCRILFVGFPLIAKINQTKLVDQTNHSFISEKSWVSGIFRNRFSILRYLKFSQPNNFSKNTNPLLALKSKPHLVVIFDHNLEASVIDEFYKAKIPILSFGCSSVMDSKITYKILGNFDFLKTNLQTIYFFLLYSLLKQKPISKKKILYRLSVLRNVSKTI